MHLWLSSSIQSPRELQGNCISDNFGLITAFTGATLNEAHIYHPLCISAQGSIFPCHIIRNWLRNPIINFRAVSLLQQWCFWRTLHHQLCLEADPDVWICAPFVHLPMQQQRHYAHEKIPIKSEENNYKTSLLLFTLLSSQLLKMSLSSFLCKKTSILICL